MIQASAPQKEASSSGQTGDEQEVRHHIVPPESSAASTPPQVSSTLIAEAWSLRSAGRPEEAEQRFREAVATGAREADAFYGIGTIALDQGDRRGAKRALTLAVESDPRHANALFKLGALAETGGLIEAASDFYHRALAEDPKHASANRRLSALAARPTRQVERSQREPRQEIAGSHDDAVRFPPLAVDPVADGIVGRVALLDLRGEGSARLQFRVLTFRLERMNPNGEPMSTMAVTMRGLSLDGSIHNGDWVQLPTARMPSRPLTRITNLTTGETVRMKTPVTLRAMRGFGAAFVLAFVALLVLFVYVWLRNPVSPIS
jgi:hypothetical protein